MQDGAGSLESTEDEEHDDDSTDEEEVVEIEKNNFHSAWDLVVKGICTLNDPLVASVMTQGTYLNFDPISGRLDIEFSSELAFFKTLLEDTHKVWAPFIQETFKQPVQLHAVFTGIPQKKTEPILSSKPISSLPVSEYNGSGAFLNVASPVKAPVNNNRFEKKQEKASAPFNNKYAGYKSSSVSLQGLVIDISDTSVWKTAHMIMRHFPGTVREIRE